eukprot:2635393-Ditylum_brightwellii.AAC.1
MRIAHLHQALKCRNHKSAMGKANKKVLANLMTEDVDLGYGIPLPIEILPNIPFAEVYPLGVQHQQSTNKMGNVITKDRVSHNLLFLKDFMAINDRVITDLLEPCHYGHSLHRVCHYIHNMRLFYPTTRILMHKCDIKKAYCRLHTRGRIAAACITVVQNLAAALL